jgi:spore coat protein U-like protein
MAPIRDVLAGCGAALTAATVLLAAAPAAAQLPSSSSFNVKASVSGACAASTSTSDLNFGSYVESSPSTANVTVSVTCTTPVSIKIGFSGGTGSDGTNRNMDNGSGVKLRYLLNNVGGAVIPADTAQGFMTNARTGSYAVSGVIPAGQVVPQGSYTDVVQVTFSY